MHDAEPVNGPQRGRNAREEVHGIGHVESLAFDRVGECLAREPLHGQERHAGFRCPTRDVPHDARNVNGRQRLSFLLETNRVHGIRAEDTLIATGSPV